MPSHHPLDICIYRNVWIHSFTVCHSVWLATTLCGHTERLLALEGRGVIRFVGRVARFGAIKTLKKKKQKKRKSQTSKSNYLDN